MNILTRIQELCNEQGISLRQLEKSVGIGNGIIARWEHSSPKVSSLDKVANYFNVSLDYLAGKTDVKKPNCVSEQVETATPSKVQELVSLIQELNHQNLILNGEPIDSDMIEIIKIMLKSNLDAWELITLQKKNLYN